MKDYLHIEEITKRFGETDVLKGISLTIPKGDFVALLGPSGCGKSTLLKIISGLETETAGRIRLSGEWLAGVPAFRRDIGVVFQSYALFPHLSVAENVRFGLDMRQMGRAEANERVREALDLVKLDGLSERMPRQLSGGQQQRVAIARALAIRPRLLLLDEPLSNLDAILRKSVRVDLRELHDRVGATTVMVTHDQEEAMSMADKVAVMHDGAIEQWGSPEDIYERPATAFIGTFVGNPPASLVKARRHLSGGWSIGGTTWTPDPALTDKLDKVRNLEITLGLRAERIDIVDRDTPGAFVAELTSSEYLGGERLLHFLVDDHRVSVAHAGAALEAGQFVGLRPRTADVMLFDINTGLRIDAR
ncbi:ABC transporter ATP-binding protein [Pleomorphomonas sp. PLEO]|uniref:ABC transporter ATP-binding protein n=1 Tax=Pleomorphomonas sp. PLEO TaxID=3239306 RepID=UPI00351E7DA1